MRRRRNGAARLTWKQPCRAGHHGLHRFLIAPPTAHLPPRAGFLTTRERLRCSPPQREICRRSGAQQMLAAARGFTSRTITGATFPSTAPTVLATLFTGRHCRATLANSGRRAVVADLVFCDGAARRIDHAAGRAGSVGMLPPLVCSTGSARGGCRRAGVWRGAKTGGSRRV
jgi:hypothetical protein